MIDWENTMQETRPDYFQATTPVETVLRRIKGNYRRALVLASIANDGPDSVPEPWLAHDLSEVLKNMLGAKQPNFRGGEDLPDLLEGEVEIARVSLVDSVHGEVTSLRARKDGDVGSIRLRIVDEYGDFEYELERDTFHTPRTAAEVLEVFKNSEPCACLSSCEQRFSSDFYPDLDDLADELNIKQVWED